MMRIYPDQAYKHSMQAHLKWKCQVSALKRSSIDICTLTQMCHSIDATRGLDTRNRFSLMKKCTHSQMGNFVRHTCSLPSLSKYCPFLTSSVTSRNRSRICQKEGLSIACCRRHAFMVKEYVRGTSFLNTG